MASTVAVLGTLLACTVACVDSDPRSADILHNAPGAETSATVVATTSPGAAPAFVTAASNLSTAFAITASGPVQGSVSGDLAIFRGIPYAAAPVGARRFAPPAAPAPWSTPRAATAFGAACPQNAPDGQPPPSGTTVQSEDCLSLNVWTHTAGGPRPIIVWIHGGGYIAGTAGSVEYDGAALARTGDAVVVSFNYRLGLLGFLALPQLTAGDGGTGNWGLRDQIAALAWVHRNIAAFGGDPRHVLIAGESAGGASICTLLAAPAAQPLFTAAAMQSGSCRLVLATDHTTGNFPSAFGVGLVTALDLGCTSGDIAACLRATPRAAVLATQRKLSPTLDLGVPITPTLPVVDGVVLDERPMAALRAGRGNVPLIAGANHDDTSVFVRFADAPGAFAAYLTAIGQSSRASALLALYPPQQLGERGAAIAFSTDLAFACPALALAALHPATSRLYELERPIVSGKNVGLGAVHGLDFIYLFGTFGAWDIAADPERPLSTVMQLLWSAIARGQSPTIWPTAPLILQLDTTSSISTTWRNDRCPALAALGLLAE